MSKNGLLLLPMYGDGGSKIYEAGIEAIPPDQMQSTPSFTVLLIHMIFPLKYSVTHFFDFANGLRQIVDAFGTINIPTSSR
jgi:hypothetical protein